MDSNESTTEAIANVVGRFYDAYCEYCGRITEFYEVGTAAAVCDTCGREHKYNPFED